MQIIIFALCWLGGIAAATLLPYTIWGWMAAGLITLASGLIVGRKNPYLTIYFLYGITFWCAGIRHHWAQPVITAEHIAYYSSAERSAEQLTLEGVISQPPDIRDRYVNVRLESRWLTLNASEHRNGSRIPISGDVLVRLPRYPVYPIGTQITVRGRLEVPPSNPAFSYRDYLAGQGIYALISQPEIIETAPPERGARPIQQAIYSLRDRAQIEIEHLIPAPQSGLLIGILLGVDHLMPPDIVEAFKTTGITHIVVISGFNISIVAAVFLRTGTPLLGHRRAAWGAIIGITLYTILVGADAAVVRAAIMGGLYVFSDRMLGRSSYAVGSLFLAAVIMTLFRPAALWDVGFQLSFAATLSLMLYATPLANWAKRQLSRRINGAISKQAMTLINEAILVTLAAQILTIPLLIFYFGQLSLVSLLANALILPVQGAIMLWGTIALIGGWIWSPLGIIPAWIANLALQYTIQTSLVLSHIPYGLVKIELSRSALLFTYAAIAAGSWYGAQQPEKRIDIAAQVKSWFPAHIGPITTMLLLVLAWQYYQGLPDGRLHVTFFDVGQGDATLIQTPSGRTILIDGGYYPTIIKRHLGDRLPFWDRKIDIVIATHPDADHVNGLPDLFTRYDVEQLWISFDPDVHTGAGEGYIALLEAAAKQETKIRVISGGEQLHIEPNFKMTVLHPYIDDSRDNRNDASIVLKLHYGRFSAILPGDAEWPTEQKILETNINLSTYILKAGHHGANNASSVPWLATTQPQIVIVSAGEGNQFGHPHPDMLARAAAIGAMVLRTDQLGTIHVSTNGKQIWWSAQP